MGEELEKEWNNLLNNKKSNFSYLNRFKKAEIHDELEMVKNFGFLALEINILF